MKTLKYAIIAVFVTCTMVSLAKADGLKEKPKNIISLTLEKALHNQGLVVAMYQQLNPSFLNNNQLTYTVSVNFEGTLYRISGTYSQWREFFRRPWGQMTQVKPVIIDN